MAFFFSVIYIFCKCGNEQVITFSIVSNEKQSLVSLFYSLSQIIIDLISRGAGIQEFLQP